jgi:hypothetical protein
MGTAVSIESLIGTSYEKVIFGRKDSSIPCFPSIYSSFLSGFRWHISMLHVIVAVARSFRHEFA